MVCVKLTKQTWDFTSAEAISTKKKAEQKFVKIQNLNLHLSGDASQSEKCDAKKKKYMRTWPTFHPKGIMPNLGLPRLINLIPVQPQHNNNNNNNSSISVSVQIVWHHTKRWISWRLRPAWYLLLQKKKKRGKTNTRASCQQRNKVSETTSSLFVWLVADGWCWFVVREKYCWLVAGGWFVLREKYCWLVADKPNEQAANYSYSWVG
jgi:hypothetical protein